MSLLEDLRTDLRRNLRTLNRAIMEAGRDHRALKACQKGQRP